MKLVELFIQVFCRGVIQPNNSTFFAEIMCAKKFTAVLAVGLYELRERLQNRRHWHGMCEIDVMKQMSLSESGFERKTKRTRKREFL
ncbi:hypothetical protein B0E41_00100, partial [Hydrogenophaga sp. A37]